jgi:hypothetical protein
MKRKLLIVILILAIATTFVLTACTSAFPPDDHTDATTVDCIQFRFLRYNGLRFSPYRSAVTFFVFKEVGEVQQYTISENNFRFVFHSAKSTDARGRRTYEPTPIELSIIGFVENFDYWSATFNSFEMSLVENQHRIISVIIELDRVIAGGISAGIVRLYYRDVLIYSEATPASWLK